MGTITQGKSYIPSGLTAAQYNKDRASAQAKKDARYKMNVAKAGKFLGYDEFYLKRGTDLKAGWKKDVTLGHRMTKTKCVRAKRERSGTPGWGFDDDI